jgi:hypothetical protein
MGNLHATCVQKKTVDCTYQKMDMKDTQKKRKKKWTVVFELTCKKLTFMIQLLAPQALIYENLAVQAVEP